MEYEARRQAIFVSVDTANAKEGRGGGHQAPPVQWPGQGDGLPLPENMQVALNNQQAHHGGARQAGQPLGGHGVARSGV